MATDPLAHIPGDAGPPLVGHTLAFLRDARRLMDTRRERYGDVFKVRVLGRTNVVFLTPEANRHIYLDPDRIFSSELGWSSSIGPLFRNGLMLRDFEDHHLHRRVMQQAFRRSALEGYVAAIHQVIDRHLDHLGPGPVDIYRFMKRLTLDIAAGVFVGASLGAQAQAVNDAFVAMMAASVTPLRLDLPGTPYRRGMRGRRRLDAIFGALVTERRVRPEAGDLLSRLSHARTESGELLPDSEVVDHMVFLLLAAHDTTTATLAVLLYELARNPQWQQRVGEEVGGLNGAAVTVENHKTLTDTSNAMNEALRLSPPVPFSPRMTLRDTVIEGWKIPKGTGVGSSSMVLHRDPKWWTDPDRFDPDRFAPNRAEDKQHSHLFFPFGGGAHLCIGNHLAEVITKAVVARLLVRHKLAADPNDHVVIQAVPIPKPKSALMLNLS